MHRLVFLFALAAVCVAQKNYNGQSQTAAILSDSRYLQGDGTFGSAYKQEDGVEFHEESDPDGNRRGSYSYVDPSGQRRTVSYTAGKNGFQATGDHLPRAPVPVAPAPPQPQYQPQPQYNPTPQYNPQPQPQARYNPVPAPAPAPYTSPAGYDDGSYREEYNNPNYQSRNAAPPAPANNNQFNYSFGNSQPPKNNNNNNYYQAPQVPYQQTTTPATHRFNPPGNLNLNRTPDGFSYTFSKN